MRLREVVQGTAGGNAGAFGGLHSAWLAQGGTTADILASLAAPFTMGFRIWQWPPPWSGQVSGTEGWTGQATRAGLEDGPAVVSATLEGSFDAS